MKKKLTNEKDFRTIEYKNFDLGKTSASTKKVKMVKSIKMKKTDQSLKTK